MSLKIEYGGNVIESRNLDNADVLKGTEQGYRDEDPNKIMKRSISHLICRDMERSELKDNKNIGFIVNDRDRPTPTHLIFDLIFEDASWMFDRISKVHIATGSHREPSEDEIRTILGKAYEHLHDKVHIHRATDKEGHISYGRSSSGNELFFDRELEGHDLYFFINSVEPHYFAGFTGGRKSIHPGMAYFSTIEYNHRLALDNASKTLELAGNPVHEDMEEAAGIFLRNREHIAVQMVQGPEKVLTSVHIGNIFDSFYSASRRAIEQFCIPIQKRYDIVVSVARSPMDKTLYQAQKSMENGKLALKDGGVLILVAYCSEGIGQSKFWELLSTSNDPDEIISRIKDGYELGYHKAAKIVQLHKRAKIMIVSSLDPAETKKVFMKGFGLLDDALVDAISNSGKDPSILVIPNGTLTVPYINDVEGKN
ncbi:MAG: nickel-dependent lactate racemase [Candidatus Thermoplasmatota archaeon]|nr:nickel-dependent lactate racemase [Candidatus Thermoplasmatota archaeon]